MFGFLNIYKPKGLTSHDVVAKLRKILKIKQIGHTGTLDPLAEGVLPIAVGKASRLIEYLQDDKSYRVTFEFGKISDTFDTEGNIEFFSDKKVTQEELVNILQDFNGEIEQTPPAFSAVHYNGKRLYELARQGIIPDDIPKRKIFIEKISLISFDYNLQQAVLDIDCSKGTYIRSIVSDIGFKLHAGAIMIALVRTKSGSFVLDDAIYLEQIEDALSVEQYLKNPVSVLPFKSYVINDEQYQKVIYGQKIPVREFEVYEYLNLIFNDKLCAIAQKSDDCYLTLKKVFPL